MLSVEGWESCLLIDLVPTPVGEPIVNGRTKLQLKHQQHWIIISVSHSKTYQVLLWWQSRHDKAKLLSVKG